MRTSMSACVCLCLSALAGSVAAGRRTRPVAPAVFPGWDARDGNGAVVNVLGTGFGGTIVQTNSTIPLNRRVRWNGDWGADEVELTAVAVCGTALILVGVLSNMEVGGMRNRTAVRSVSRPANS